MAGGAVAVENTCSAPVCRSMMRLSSPSLAVDVFLDDQPAAALVDLALVVVALRGDEGRRDACLSLIDDAAESCASCASWTVAECTLSSLLECICQMYLSAPRLLAHVEDGLDRLES